MSGMLLQLSRSLSRAAPVLRRSIHSGTRPASTTAATKLTADRQFTSEEIYAREEKYGAHNYHPLPVALERGEGEFIFLKNKNKKTIIKSHMNHQQHFPRPSFSSLLQASMCGMWRAAGIMTS